MTATLLPTLPPRVAVLPDVLVVDIDEEDLLLGVRRSARDCPKARAIRRALVLMGYTPLTVCVGSVVGGSAVVSIDVGSDMQAYDDDSGWFQTAYDCSGNPPPCTVTLVRLP